MVVEFKFPPIRLYIDVSRVELAQVEGEPVQNVQDVSFLSNAKSRDVLIDGNHIAVFGYSMGARCDSTISTSCWTFIETSDLVLLMMAISVPCMPNPHHSDEHSLFTDFVTVEMVSLLL